MRSPAGSPLTAIDPVQALFRLQFAGPRGSIALRLVLRRAARDRYEMRAAGPLGRTLWRLAVAEGTALLIDERNGRFCRMQGEARLEALRLPPLPLETLAAALLGEPPVPAAVGDGHGEWRADGGRRWTWSAHAGRVLSWTLWQEGRPLVWWRRESHGGLLSVRGGAQLRWSEVVREPLRESLAAPQAPTGGVEADCDALGLP